jgi:AbrB family looped-hinge helix DNA binding protein
MAIDIPVRGTSTISVKGQTVVPKEIRKALTLKEGTRLAWTLREGKLSVFPIPEDPVGALMGLLKGYGTYDEWLAERNAERERERIKDEEEIRRWRDTSSTPRP